MPFMDFLPEVLSEYVRKHSDPESQLLAELNRVTHLNVKMPRMLSGQVQGRMLSMFSKMIQPEYILEIGTYTGYSALCLAEGIKKGGKLLTIDQNEELRPILEKYLKKSIHSEKIKLLFGNALEVIPDLPSGMDMVFIDADKENYVNYFDLIIDSVKEGGYILADNVLWKGHVVDASKDNDRRTKAIKAFNAKVQEDKRVENVLLSVRDGMMVMRKKPTQ